MAVMIDMVSLKLHVFRENSLWQWWCPNCSTLAADRRWGQPEAFAHAEQHATERLRNVGCRRRD